MIYERVDEKDIMTMELSCQLPHLENLEVMGDIEGVLGVGVGEEVVEVVKPRPGNSWARGEGGE